jgi:predicted glycoside hydrolase/deacetylase ChbG (UPF0249 family)
VIDNEDDLGLTEGVSRGVVEAHVNGIVSSATAMVRQPAAIGAVARARVRLRLGVGLHVDLRKRAFARPA